MMPIRTNGSHAFPQKFNSAGNEQEGNVIVLLFPVHNVTKFIN